MPVINAVYVAGKSQLPQARPASAVSPAYLDGESGLLPILAYAAAGGASQFARPSSDVAVGGWNNQVPNQTDVFESINETAALLSDTDYVQSGAAPVDDTLIVGLTAINPPGAGTVTIRIRAKFL